jgi:uncharacterized protein (UPF0333 family)
MRGISLEYLLMLIVIVIGVPLAVIAIPYAISKGTKLSRKR